MGIPYRFDNPENKGPVEVKNLVIIKHYDFAIEL